MTSDHSILMNYEPGHDKPVTSVCSNDELIFTSSKDGTIRVWDKNSFQEAIVFSSNEGAIRKLYLEEESLYTLLDFSVVIWDIKTLTIKGRIHFHFKARNFYIDNKKIYIYSRYGIELWDKATLTKIPPPKIEEMVKKEKALNILIGDGERLFLGWCLIGDRYIEEVGTVIDENTGKRIAGLKEGAVEELEEIIIDREKIYGVAQKRLAIWDRNTLEQEKVDGKINVNIRFVCLTQDENNLYAAGSDGRIVVFNKTTLEQLCSFKAHANKISSILVDDEFLYSASNDCTVKIWDKKTFAEKAILGTPYRIHTFFIKDNQQYFLASDAKQLIIKKSPPGGLSLEPNLGQASAPRFVNKVEGKQKNPILCSFSDEQFVYAGAQDGTIKIWDKEKKKQIAIFRGHKKAVLSLVADEEQTYSGSTDGQIKIWDKTNYEEVKTLKLFYPLNLFVNKELLFVEIAKKIYVWEKPKYEKEEVFTKEHFSVQYHTEDHERLFFSFINKIIIVAKASLQEMRILDLPNKVLSVASDERFIYAGTVDGKVIVREKKNYKKTGELPGHLAEIRFLRVDSKFIYSGCWGIEIKIWDKETFKEVTTIPRVSKKFAAMKSPAILVGRAEWLSVDDTYLYVHQRQENKINIWNKETFQYITSLEGFIRMENFQADAQCIYFYCKGLHIWEKNPFKLIKTIKSVQSEEEGEEVEVISHAVDGDFIYLKRKDNRISILSKKSYELQETLDCPETEGDYSTIYVDNDYLYDLAKDRLGIWNKKSKKLVKIIKIAEELRFLSLELFIDEEFLYVLGASSGKLQIFCKKELKEKAFLKLQNNLVAFHADKEYIYYLEKYTKLHILDKKKQFREIKKPIFRLKGIPLLTDLEASTALTYTLGESSIIISRLSEESKHQQSLQKEKTKGIIFEDEKTGGIVVFPKQGRGEKSDKNKTIREILKAYRKKFLN